MVDITSLVIAFVAVVIAIAAIVIAYSHRGPAGPAGPQGPQGEGTIPAGTIVAWANADIPDGWYPLGSKQLDIASNPVLSNLGPPLILNKTTTTFDLVDWGGLFVIGAKGGSFSVGQTGGTDSVTLALNNIPPHTHTVTQLADTNIGGGGSGGWRGTTVVASGSTGGNSSGGTDPFPILPPYVASNWIVKGG